MKNKKMISANEINRFIYCPYQWYYTRVYGQKTIREKYKLLPHSKSRHESHFIRGLKFHKQYYRLYRIKRLVGIILLIGIVILTVLGGFKWLKV